MIVIIEKYRGVAHGICNLKYNLPKKLPIVFNNGSNYEFNFIIKELAEDSKNYLLAYKILRDTTFKVPVEEKVTRIGKNGEQITENISYIFKFIDRAKYLSSSLSDLVNNCYEGIQRIQCKYKHDDKKKSNLCGINSHYK